VYNIVHICLIYNVNLICIMQYKVITFLHNISIIQALHYNKPIFYLIRGP